MKKIISTAAALACFAAMPLSAAAADNDREGLYGVVGLGKTDVFAPGKGTSHKASSGRLGYTLGAGYRVNNYFALESDLNGQFGGKKNSKKNSGKDRLTGSAMSVSALGILPIGDSFELYGRVGGAYMKNRFSPGADSTVTKVSSSSFAPVYGAGANFHVTDNAFIRTEWTTMRTRKNDKVAIAAGGQAVRNAQYNVAFGYNF